jgi:hypothetical protein
MLYGITLRTALGAVQLNTELPVGIKGGQRGKMIIHLHLLLMSRTRGT